MISMRLNANLVWILRMFMVRWFYFVYERMLKKLSNTDTLIGRPTIKLMCSFTKPVYEVHCWEKWLFIIMNRRKQFQVWQRWCPIMSKSLLTWLSMTLHSASSGEGEGGGGEGGDLASCFMTVSGKHSSHKCLSALSPGPHTFVGCWWNQRVTQWICNNSFSVWVINSHYRGTAKHSCGCCLHFEPQFGL